jgi:hypothetical protein
MEFHFEVEVELDYPIPTGGAARHICWKPGTVTETKLIGGELYAGVELMLVGHTVLAH